MEEGELGHAKLVFHWPEHFTSLYPGQLSRKKKKNRERKRRTKKGAEALSNIFSRSGLDATSKRSAFGSLELDYNFVLSLASLE